MSTYQSDFFAHPVTPLDCWTSEGCRPALLRLMRGCVVDWLKKGLARVVPAKILENVLEFRQGGLVRLSQARSEAGQRVNLSREKSAHSFDIDNGSPHELTVLSSTRYQLVETPKFTGKHHTTVATILHQADCDSATILKLNPPPFSETEDIPRPHAALLQFT